MAGILHRSAPAPFRREGRARRLSQPRRTFRTIVSPLLSCPASVAFLAGTAPQGASVLEVDVRELSFLSRRIGGLLLAILGFSTAGASPLPAAPAKPACS